MSSFSGTLNLQENVAALRKGLTHPEIRRASIISERLTGKKISGEILNNLSADDILQGYAG